MVNCVTGESNSGCDKCSPMVFCMWQTAIFTQLGMTVCIVHCNNTNVMRRIKTTFNQEDCDEEHMKVTFSTLPIPKDDYDKLCAALLGIPLSHYNVCLMDPSCSYRIPEIIENDGLHIVCKRTQTKIYISKVLPSNTHILRPIPIRSNKVAKRIFV